MYSAWRHVPSNPEYPRLYVYLMVGAFPTILALQTVSVALRNGIFRHALARAQISDSNGAARIYIDLHQPLDVKVGQYVNLWMPTTLWSAFQTHPFVVISWAEHPQQTLELLIEPRQGFTRDLLSQAKNNQDPLALFSGPHGLSAPVDEFETVVMVATGWGIAAHVPYLNQLISGYNKHKVRARRVHLIWQIRDIGKRTESSRFAELTKQMLALPPNHSLISF